MRKDESLVDVVVGVEKVIRVIKKAKYLDELMQASGRPAVAEKAVKQLIPCCTVSTVKSGKVAADLEPHVDA